LASQRQMRLRKCMHTTYLISPYELLTHPSLFETREEMLEGSTPDLSKIPLAL
jgi:hypothetical protein